MELYIVQIILLVFLVTYLWAEEQAEVTIIENFHIDNSAPYYVWQAWYDKEVAYEAETTREAVEAIYRSSISNKMSNRS